MRIRFKALKPSDEDLSKTRPEGPAARERASERVRKTSSIKGMARTPRTAETPREMPRAKPENAAGPRVKAPNVVEPKVPEPKRKDPRRE